MNQGRLLIGLGWGRSLQLWGLGALDSESGEISGLGRRMARMPLDPPLARAMCAAEVRQRTCAAARVSVNARVLVCGERCCKAAGGLDGAWWRSR